MKGDLTMDDDSSSLSPEERRKLKHRLEMRAYYQANPEAMRERQRSYRREHPEAMREYEKRRREKHKDVIKERKKRWQQSEAYKAYQRQYQIDHRDDIVEWRRQHYEANAEQVKARQRQYGKTEQGRLSGKVHEHKRRAQKKACEGAYTAQQLKEQLTRQKRKCYYCHVKLTEYHVEHIVPLSRGGSNTIDNIVLSCPSCNMRKNAKLPHEWHQGNRLL